MLGIAITREVALREIDALEEEVVDRIAAAARAHTLPVGSEMWQRWTKSRDQRLLVLDVLRELVRKQPHELLRPEER